MSEIELKLKEENEYQKELFNWSGDESHLKNIKDFFANYIKNSKSHLNFLLI